MYLPRGPDATTPARWLTGGLPMASTLTARDSVRLHRYVTLPTLLGGFVAPNPAFVPRLVRWQTTARAVHFLRGIRDKYGSRAWFLFPFAWTLLVLDGDGIEEVLASHDTVADPVAKRAFLRRFTPDGVIVSRDPEWGRGGRSITTRSHSASRRIPTATPSSTSSRTRFSGW